jgi:hypothetical protein
MFRFGILTQERQATDIRNPKLFTAVRGAGNQEYVPVRMISLNGHSNRAPWGSRGIARHQKARESMEAGQNIHEGFGLTG